MKPKNQHQQVLWYLLYTPSINLKDVINDSMFYKFQSRLGEIETKHGVITNKKRIKFTNKFGTKSSYIEYSLKDCQKAKELFNKY